MRNRRFLCRAVKKHFFCSFPVVKYTEGINAAFEVHQRLHFLEGCPSLRKAKYQIWFVVKSCGCLPGE